MLCAGSDLRREQLYSTALIANVLRVVMLEVAAPATGFQDAAADKAVIEDKPRRRLTWSNACLRVPARDGTIAS